jgi:tRNA(fMet)-specific endonuclease VapC
MRWMLDINICIAMIRAKPPQLLRRFQTKAIGQVGTSTLVLAELEFGVALSSTPERNREALEAFSVSLDVAPFDVAAARSYGPLRARLAAAGTPIGPLDTLIAAHALALDVTLVTHNTKEFRRVKGLQVEDWLAA